MTRLPVTITKRNFIFESKQKISKVSLNLWDRLQILYESSGWKFQEMKSSNPPRPCGILLRERHGAGAAAEASIVRASSTPVSSAQFDFLSEQDANNLYSDVSVSGKPVNFGAKKRERRETSQKNCHVPNASAERRSTLLFRKEKR